MPVRHEIDVNAALVLVELSGKVSAAEIFAYYSALSEDPELVAGLSVLADCRQVTSGPSFMELHQVATAKGKLPLSLRPTRAAVIVNKGWLFGIVRQFASLADGGGIRVMPFFEPEEAREWLARYAASSPSR
ncbi:MAG TPA: STAS/SEC14 domain-containing protein [Gemmatimonadaceae bacterium]|nr:STAS/SEC14 domain-containing protein [Gemmatimonadaceae bacterium]